MRNFGLTLTWNPIERELTGGDKADVDRVVFEGVGRVVKFSEMPNRYRGLREYYFQRYNQPFSNDVDEVRERLFSSNGADSVVRQWRLEYEGATEEERTKKSLTPEPTPRRSKRSCTPFPFAWKLT